MKSIHGVLLSLFTLLVIIFLAWTWAPVEYATGFPHPNPEFKGIFISKANIDQAPHTRWLGYLFGLGIIGLMTSLFILGNRKKGEPTGIIKWIWITMAVYTMVYSGMVFSHWQYEANDGGSFFLVMPGPTAWKIFGIWFVPLIITMAYIFKFEDWVIDDDEIREFHQYLENRRLEN